MRIGVTGASGLVGGALVPSLRQAGHDVLRFVRQHAGAPDERTWDPAAGWLDPEAVADLDAVVHLAGAGIADKRWSAEYKELVRASRIDGTTAVAGAIAAAREGGQGPSVLLSGSAIGFYGETGDRLTDEHGPVGSGFLASVVRD